MITWETYYMRHTAHLALQQKCRIQGTVTSDLEVSDKCQIAENRLQDNQTDFSALV